MKKIIKNKKYDTDTAREVGRWEPDHAKSDFAWYEETLYRKKTGEYFIHGAGHAASPYRRRSGGMWAPGEGITPIGIEEAREWAEEHLDAEAYEAEWGKPPDDEEVYISARISLAAKRALESEAMRTGEQQQMVIDRLLLGLQSD